MRDVCDPEFFKTRKERKEKKNCNSLNVCAVYVQVSFLKKKNYLFI